MCIDCGETIEDALRLIYDPKTKTFKPICGRCSRRR